MIFRFAEFYERLVSRRERATKLEPELSAVEEPGEPEFVVRGERDDDEFDLDLDA